MPSTATEWLMRNPDDVYALGELLGEVANFPMRLWVEMPLWMKEEIAKQLSSSFKEPYWEDIARTTMGDAERALSYGLEEGWSIRKIAAGMRGSLGGDSYAKVRAMNIARTESGNALNGARKAALDRLMQDIGPKVPMRPTWLSVLGNTTRDSHASLDGVPADGDGMWELAGYKIPWPGHISLPPSERCNCQCTVVMEFGMQDSEAVGLIQDYYDRDESNLGKSVELTEKFNPYHDSAGRFASGHGGGSGGSGVERMETEEEWAKLLTKEENKDEQEEREEV